MTTRPGARKGPYEIVPPLGAGGKGEFCWALDSTVDREVERLDSEMKQALKRSRTHDGNVN
jgi:hypothetical protein